MRLLFVKHALGWPRSHGHDVHCYHMMRALIDQGHAVALATVDDPAPEATAGLSLVLRRAIGTDRIDDPSSPLAGLRERFRSYWGIAPARIVAVARAAEDCDAEAVVAVGLDVLPFLGGVSGRRRVWYAGDEWAWHHLSQVRPLVRSSWGHVKEAAIKGLYERAFAPLLDRVWVVSEADRRAMALVVGSGKIDVVPNGVDAEHYRPVDVLEEPESCVFWGRLDFGPNIQALDWFCRRVWPRLRRAAPEARFTIYGFRPSSPVRALAAGPGIELVPDLPDLRGAIARHQVVVLPFVSGGGIKNKLLEAAGLGKAIVASARACNGLDRSDEAPVVVARSAASWERAVRALWADAEARRRRGAAARDWVVRHHTWAGAALRATAGLTAGAALSGAGPVASETVGAAGR